MAVHLGLRRVSVCGSICARESSCRALRAYPAGAAAAPALIEGDINYDAQWLCAQATAAPRGSSIPYKLPLSESALSLCSPVRTLSRHACDS
eukprot:1999083-Prymnesium_polylepis.2